MSLPRHDLLCLPTEAFWRPFPAPGTGFHPWWLRGLGWVEQASSKISQPQLLNLQSRVVWCTFPAQNNRSDASPAGPVVPRLPCSPPPPPPSSQGLMGAAPTASLFRLCTYGAPAAYQTLGCRAEGCPCFPFPGEHPEGDSWKWGSPPELLLSTAPHPFSPTLCKSWLRIKKQGWSGCVQPE